VWRARPLIAGRQAKNWRVLKSSRIRIVAKNRNGRNTLKRIIATLAALPSPCLAAGQKSTPPSPAQVAQAVRDYRTENEDRIVREENESRFQRVAQGRAAFITTIGGFTRGRLPMINRPLWRCSRRWMRCG